MRLPKGTSWIAAVAPGWILSFRVGEVLDDGTLVLEEPAWLEMTKSADNVLFAATRDISVVSASWPLEDGTQVHPDAVLFALPVQNEDNIRALHAAKALDAIRQKG